MAPSRFWLRDISPAFRDVVISGPFLILPPGMKIAGMSSLAAALSWAGIDLSQEEDSIIPSQGYTRPCISIISHMASLDARI